MERKLRSVKKLCLWRRLLFLVFFSASSASADLPPECGTLENHVGPYDYRSPPRDSLRVVEEAHFDVNVARLQVHAKCQRNKARCSPVSGDLGYTLEAFPNHHKALYAMARYHLIGMDRAKKRMRYSAECYFRRAIEFRPDDPSVRMIHGYYLAEIGNTAAAESEYEQALAMAPDSAEVNYNAGLFFLEVNDVDRATECAVRAYGLGHPLPGLRNGLQAKGVDLDLRLP